MNDILLFMLSAFAAIITFVFFVSSCESSNTNKEAAGFVIVSSAFLALSIGGFIWLFNTNSQPWEEDSVSYYELKEVDFPNGTKSQMFVCDGENIDATRIFGKFVDEKNYEVKRTKYKCVYHGVSYGDNSKYTIVKKVDNGIKLKGIK